MANSTFFCDAASSECESFALIWATLAAAAALAWLLWWCAGSQVLAASRRPALTRAVRTAPEPFEAPLSSVRLLSDGSPPVLVRPASGLPPPPPDDGGGRLSEQLEELSWEQLGYRVGRERILQPSSGRIRPGLWAMIGPSGAGKSSLLGVLAGRKARGASSGRVRLNGEEAAAAARRRRIGYVTQDDVLPGTSTVAEHLHFHAALRLPWLGREERGACTRGQAHGAMHKWPCTRSHAHVVMHTAARTAARSRPRLTAARTLASLASRV